MQNEIVIEEARVEMNMRDKEAAQLLAVMDAGRAGQVDIETAYVAAEHAYRDAKKHFYALIDQAYSAPAAKWDHETEAEQSGVMWDTQQAAIAATRGN